MVNVLEFMPLYVNVGGGDFLIPCYGHDFAFVYINIRVPFRAVTSQPVQVILEAFFSG